MLGWKIPKGGSNAHTHLLLQVWAASLTNTLFRSEQCPGPRGAGVEGQAVALRVPLLACPHLIWAKQAVRTLTPWGHDTRRLPGARLRSGPGRQRCETILRSKPPGQVQGSFYSLGKVRKENCLAHLGKRKRVTEPASQCGAKISRSSGRGQGPEGKTCS